MFEKQRDFINGTSKRKALNAGRRGGKSYAAAYYLIKKSFETPQAECLYIALTLKSAKKIILPTLKSIIERYHLSATLNYSDMTFTFANGSRLSILGADTDKMADRLRGLSFDLVVIDEAQAFTSNLESLINDVLIPAIRERDGTCALIGTPHVVCAGMFYNITTGVLPNWSCWHWDLTENRYYGKWRNKTDWREFAKKELDIICLEENMSRDSDRFRREYLGEWVQGSSSMVFKFNSNINTFDELPTDLKEVNHLFGIDFGISDPSAILVGAWSPQSRVLWILSEFKASEVTPESLAERIKTRYDEFLPVSVVVDGNGIGAAFIAQLTSMYNLPIELAEKRDKVAFISILNDELRAGRIKISNKCSELIRELTYLTWEDPILQILPDKAEDHCCDAFLYLFRRSLHFKGSKPIKPTKLTAKEYGDRLLEEELDRVNTQNNINWWEN